MLVAEEGFMDKVADARNQQELTLTTSCKKTVLKILSQLLILFMCHIGRRLLMGVVERGLICRLGVLILIMLLMGK